MVVAHGLWWSRRESFAMSLGYIRTSIYYNCPWSAYMELDCWLGFGNYSFAFEMIVVVSGHLYICTI